MTDTLFPTKPSSGLLINDINSWAWLDQNYQWMLGKSWPVVIQTSNFTVDLNFFYPCDATAGNITVTLPAVNSQPSKQYQIKKIDNSAHTITVTAVGSDTIDGVATKVLSNQYDNITILSDGINTWEVIGKIGDAGAAGATGATGATGDKGATGATGAAGADGGSITTTISGFVPIYADLTGAVVPLASSFTQRGSGLGTPVLTDKTHRLQITVSTDSGVESADVNSISTPYTIDIAVGIVAISSSGSARIGIGLNDGTKWWEFSCGGAGSGGTGSIIVQKWTNSTTINSTPVSQSADMQSLVYWLRVTDNGTNRIAYLSANGADFTQVFSEATNTFLTPTHFGIFTVSTGADKYYVYHWKITNSILVDGA